MSSYPFTGAPLPDETFGECVTDLREARYLSQRDAAKQIGVGRRTLQEWELEEAERCKIEQLPKIIEGLDLSPDDEYRLRIAWQRAGKPKNAVPLTNKHLQRYIELARIESLVDKGYEWGRPEFCCTVLNACKRIYEQGLETLDQLGRSHE